MIGDRQSEQASPPTGDGPGAVLRDRRFWLGFAAWFVVNTLAVALLTGGRFDPNFNGGNFVVLFFFLPGNLAALIALGIIKKTRRFAAGMLAAVALNLVISLLLGLVFNAICFIPIMVEIS